MPKTIYSCYETSFRLNQLSEICRKINTKSVLFFASLIINLLLFQYTYSQQYNQQYFTQNQNQNFMRNSTAFRQEIARFEINVHREGFAPLPISQVPRVEKGDIIKVRLLDEAVNGIKLDQSLYDWTMLVVFINPNRKFSDEDFDNIEQISIENNKNINSYSAENTLASSKKSTLTDGKMGSVTEEINFRRKGWYKEHSFIVPYDSQPVFFLYPRQKYRDKILKLVNKNYNEIRKLGEKTIEIAGAYAQISSFLNNLQSVVSGNSYYNNNFGSYNSYNNGIYNSYGNYNTYNNYGYYNNGYNVPQAFNYNLLMAQSVEMLAKSFNIQLPSNCWQNGLYLNNNPYSYNQNGLLGNYGVSQDLISRVQCIGKSIRLEDFDLSVARLLQQGGVLAAAQLAQKYPQLIYWINVAAAAIDIIVKITKKTPLKIVPTIAVSSDNPGSMGSNSYNYQSQTVYQNTPNNSSSTNSGSSTNIRSTNPLVKISVFAENQPDDSQFVTAYPIVLHKWQAEPDTEVISLRPPMLTEPCLHAGINILKSTDLTNAQLDDNFTKDYVLTMRATNGFKKDFPLRKNIGLNGWELNITPQDLQQFPKVQMNLESVIKGVRGFNEIKSPPFYLPIAIGGNWEITADSQKEFTIGGKRTITIKNTLGNCQCLQAVIYKPSFGGEFVYEAITNNDNKDGNNTNLQYSPDGKDVSFTVDTTNFQPGQGELELKTYGGESVKLVLKLYNSPPTITNLKIGRGDREGIISGERIEQLQAIKINGRRATVINAQSPQSFQTNQSQAVNQNQAQNVSNQPNTASQTNSANINNTSNLQTNVQNERVFIFDDTFARITENTANVELILDDNRIHRIKQSFPVSPARPTIVANEKREIVGIPIENERPRMENGSKVQKSNPQSLVLNSQFLPEQIFPIETEEISFNVQNALTDYGFKVENLSIETRLETMPTGVTSGNNSSYSSFSNSGNNTNIPLPQVSFEVLDWKNLRITLILNAELQKLLGGRRLQFRILDKERGNSDWYSIKQTFIRFPQISSIICSPEFEGMCEMKGATIDYISQVSIDGGQTWFPQSPATLTVQPTQDGQKITKIPLLQNKKLLMIKLRDFPNGAGIPVESFSLVNTVKNNSTKKADVKSTTDKQVNQILEEKEKRKTNLPANNVSNQKEVQDKKAEVAPQGKRPAKKTKN